MPAPTPPSAKPALTVLLANPRGFCAGVERAVQMVEAALRLRTEPIYVRHEIVHNRHVVEDLEAKGAIFVDELNQVPDDAVVIFSAHGVAQSVVNEAGNRKLVSMDATCPLVNKVHQEAEHQAALGRHILLIGHEGHPEVIGTMGHVPDDAITLIQTEEDARAVTVPDPEQVAMLTQTTLSVDDTAAIGRVLRARFPAIQEPRRSDICYATTNRQDAVKAIAPRADALLVIGSPKSSNSKRLVEVARARGCARAVLIERAADIDWNELEGVHTLGVTAGASAPEVLVKEVIDFLGHRFDVTVENVTTAEEDITFSIPKALAG